MFKWIKNFTMRALILIFILEIVPIPINKNNSFKRIEEAKAFSTQLDSIAPGYSINMEGGNITFDLSSRLSKTMTVESFDFRNADPKKNQNNKPEVKDQYLKDAKWISSDVLEDGNTYEIEADIYDSDTGKTVKHINSFKYHDKNAMYRPRLRITDLNTSGGRYENQDIEIDYKLSSYLISKCQNIQIEILNADYSPTMIKKSSISSEQLIRNNYLFRIQYGSVMLEMNKDYVIRTSFDGDIWDTLMSAVVKNSKNVYNVFTPSSLGKNNNIQFNSGTIFKAAVDISVHETFKFNMNNPTRIKAFITSSDDSLPMAINYGVPSARLRAGMHSSYIGRTDPSNLRIMLVDSDDTMVLSDTTIQFTVHENATAKFWVGIGDINVEKASDGYKVMSINTVNDDKIQIPHSWDEFPRVHYITMYNGDKSKQIGGEYRVDVIKDRDEFINRTHDLKNCNFKIKYEDMKQGFNTFYFKVESSNYHKDWACAYIPFVVYADVVQLNCLQVDVVNVSNANNGYNFSFKPVNFSLKDGDKMSIIDDNGTEHISAASYGGMVSFKNVPLMIGGKYVITYDKSSSLIHFNSLEKSLLFNPTVVGTNVDYQEGIEVVFDNKYKELFNSNNSNNKVRILHMNGNATGNEHSNISLGSNKFKLSNNLVNGNSYILEFSNGSETYKSTFEYTPLKLEVESTSGTEVTLSWKYPNNYLIMDGDILNIYFKKEGFNYAAVPTAKIAHGFQGINFDEIRTYTVSDLSPNINYTAKLELVTSEGVKYVSESDEFVTSDFRILNEGIVDISDDGTVYNKGIDIIWDINQANMEFSFDDRLDIFLKLKSHDVFPRTPEYTTSENLGRIRRANIKVPTYSEDYSVRIVYVIGGVKHYSKIIDFRVELGQFELTTSDVKPFETTVNWKYSDDFTFDNGQELRIFLKKSNDPSYPSTPAKRYAHSGGTDLSKILNHKFTGLQEDTIYQAKIEYKIDEKTVAGLKEEVKKEAEIEFRTPKIIIDKFSISRMSEKSINLSWNMRDDYVYGNGDSVRIYIKERSNAVYSNGHVAGIEQKDLKPLNNVVFSLPKYGTDYDIKVSYTLNGKTVDFYTKYKLDIGSITSRIDEVTDNSISISWEYPTGYTTQSSDKLEISYKEYDKTEWKKHFYEIHSSGLDLLKYTNTKITGLEKDKKYNLKIVFSPSGLNSMENAYEFNSTGGFQISSINSLSVNSSSVLIQWETYCPKNFNFTTSDKVEIFVKEKDSVVKDSVVDGDLKYTETSNLKEFNQYKVEGLKVGVEYVFRVKYTLLNNTTDSSGTENKKEVYREVIGRPEFGQLEAYVVDNGITNVKLEVLYPENYEKLQGDILDVFIKKKESQSYGVNPNFSAVHGDKEGQVDLNEVSILEIYGLGPNTNYDVKVVFWPDGGKGLKKEYEASFRTEYIKGISELNIIEVRDYVVRIGIKMDSENLVLNSDDSCKVYIKKKLDQEYPSTPNGESSGDAFNEDNSVFAYFDELNQEYEIKVIVNISGSTYEKVIDFVSKIDDLVAEVKEINPMTVQLEWKYPDNYTFVDGESIKIFIKYKSDESFYETADFELVQSQNVNLVDTNLVELYQLIPDTEYEVKVVLSLLEINLPEIVKEFRTATFEIKDLAIKSNTDEGVAISWKINTEEVDFVDEFDNLSIYVKNPGDEKYDFSSPSIAYTKGLNDIRSALIKINKEMTVADIMVSYLIEDYETHSEIQYGSVKVRVDEDEEGVFAEWEYPDYIKFTNGDKISVYLKGKDDSSYDKDPIFECIHGEDGEDLNEVKSIGFDDLKSGEYLLKFILITQDVSYSPVEVSFKVKQSIKNDSEPVKLEKKSASSGRGLVLTTDYDVSIDYNKKIITNPSGIKVEEFKNLNDDDSFIKLSNLVPGKSYESILIEASLVDGRNVKLVVEDVKIEAESLIQQFLTNIYDFAFERFPDEEGYTYWLDNLLDKDQITGKYIVYNLMFAEREFTDRNLPDREMIKVLYQIVVNREYDQEGLEYWVKEYNENYLPQVNNDSFEAQKLIVMRMLYEQEFRNLCDKMGILW